MMYTKRVRACSFWVARIITSVASTVTLRTIFFYIEKYINK